MKKGQEYVGTVDEIIFPNKGIINYSEEKDGITIHTKVVIKGALPGQKIRFVLSKKRSSKCEGRILEVLENSILENRTAPCEKFGICGGCTYQTMSYNHQLELKKNMVKSILDEVIVGRSYSVGDNMIKEGNRERGSDGIGESDGIEESDGIGESDGIERDNRVEGSNGTEKDNEIEGRNADYIFEGIIGSPDEFGYRNKMEYSFGDECKGGELALGLHKKGSFYDIVTTDVCKIVNDDYNRILATVLRFFKERNVPYYHKMSREGYLRHLLIRRAVKTGEMIVALVTTTAIDMDFEELVNELLELPLDGKLVGIMHIYNDGLADMVRSDRTEVLYGSEFLFEEILGLKFKISTFSFFQTNSLGAERLYEKAREYVGETKDKLIFDLYSGTGTIAQILAPVAKKVIGVEIVEEAVLAARENAKLNGLDNCEFIAGDVLKVIDEIEEKPDLIVLDPPRDGIHPKALEKIIDYGVERIVYISCKPTSLARDLVVLQERGYRVERASACDMFPETYHVETVCLLGRRKPDDTIKVSVNMDDYYQIRDAEEAEKNPS